MSFDRLIQAWQASHDQHRFHSAATPDEWAAAEAHLGVLLPEAFKQLFFFSNGLSLFSSNLNVHPLKDDGPQSIVSATSWLRDCQWSIPQEVVVFGDNGSDELFGLWTGDRDVTRFPSPIVQIGSIFEDGCMTLLATSLQAFLSAETAIFLSLDGYVRVATEILALPETLVEEEPLNESAIRRWADPNVPQTTYDPYEDRLDAAVIRKMLA